jgi:aldehyde:ferredoxin oxidoreductase
LLETWDGPYIQEHYATVRNNCWACRFQHCTIMTVPDGPYQGFVGEEPEYEQFAAFGPVIDNTDPAAAFVLANECDRLGFENNELGWVLGFTMECYEKGILSQDELDGLDMRWGNVEAVRALMRKIAHRDGIGNVLADGVMRAAKTVGGEAANFAVHTLKGNTPRGHDHRLKWQELFDTGTSSTGTMEVGPMFNTELDTLQALGVDGLPDEYSPEEIAAFNAKTNGAMLFEDSLGVCRFNSRTNVPLLVEALNAATGWDITVDEAMRAGRRAANLFRCFNIRQGIGTELDFPSARYGSAPADPEAVGVSVSIRSGWTRMLAVYYAGMGWDERGVPTRATLEGLGLHWVADDFAL